MDDAVSAAVGAAAGLQSGRRLILRREHRILVQGVTGKQGSFWTRR